MEFFGRRETLSFTSSGVTSEQLVFPENSASTRITITRVTIIPGASNPQHRHPTSEQIWIALAGRGELILDNGVRKQFEAGDVVRFADGDSHGFENTGAEAFVYLSITSPPINFRGAYAKWSNGQDSRRQTPSEKTRKSHGQ